MAAADTRTDFGELVWYSEVVVVEVETADGHVLGELSLLDEV